MTTVAPETLLPVGPGPVSSLVILDFATVSLDGSGTLNALFILEILRMQFYLH